MTDIQNDIVTFLMLFGLFCFFVALAEYLAEQYFGQRKHDKEDEE